MIEISRRIAEPFPCAEFINSSISEVHGNYDTVIMNPPFGSVIKHDDMPFIIKACFLVISPVGNGLFLVLSIVESISRSM